MNFGRFALREIASSSDFDRGDGSVRLAAFAIWMLGGIAAAAANPVSTGPAGTDGCTVARMEAAPLTVVEPCTALLNQPGLSDERRSELLFVRARAHHRNGSLDLAAEDYDAAVALTPNNEEIYLGRANIEFRRGQDTDALALMQKAIAINPANPRVLRSIGAVFSSAGQIEDAIRFLSAALRIDAKEPYALLLRSQLHAQKRRYDEALADADALVDIPPEEINRSGFLDAEGRQRDFHIVALSHRADLHEELGHHDLAEADLDRAIAYKSTPGALLARGELLAGRQGKEIAALRDLDAAIKQEPNEPRAYFVRGIVLFNLRRFADATKALDTATKLQAAYPAAFRLRARANLETGKTDAALQDFITALRQDSTMMRQIMPALSAGGYWPTADIPTSITAELRQAIRKCIVDRKCT